MYDSLKITPKTRGFQIIFNHTNFHLYHYAGNNPIRYIDPNGKSDWEKRLFEKWVEQTDEGNPPSSQEMFEDYMYGANQRFICHFEKFQEDFTNGIITGLNMFVESAGTISMICYATGNIQLGLIIDGVSCFIDISLAIYDYTKSDRKAEDKIVLAEDIGSNIITAVFASKAGKKLVEKATKGLDPIAKQYFEEKLKKQINAMVGEFIGLEFDECVDKVTEKITKYVEELNK